jgi:methyl-accepting chemotaxis protein
VVISAAVPTALLGYFLTQQISGQHSDSTGLAVRLGFTILVSLLFTVVNAGLVAQTLSKPLLRLMRAAEDMENDRLTSAHAEELTTAEGSDEVGHLSRVFGRMAKEVIQREAALRLQVQTLRIEIDHGRQAREVDEITDTDFFRDLQKKAARMRAGAGTEATASVPAGDPQILPAVAATDLVGSAVSRGIGA